MPSLLPTWERILDFYELASICYQNKVSDRDPYPLYYSFLKQFLSFITLKKQPSLCCRVWESSKL